MPLDLETRNEFIDLVKQAIREVMSEGSDVVPPVNSGWAHGAALFSPPRADGAVQLKFVEVDLLKKYPDGIPYIAATLNGPVAKKCPIPRWYFIPESQSTDIAKHAVASAQFNGNRAYTLKEVVKNYGLFSRKVTEEDAQIEDAYANIFPLVRFEAMLRHLVARTEAGNNQGGTLYNLREDELDIGN